MKFFRHLIHVVFFITIGQSGFCQDIQMQEQELFLLFEQVKFAQNDAVKDSVNGLIISKFEKILKKKEAFEYSFSQLKNLGVLNSQDGRVRVLNWNIFHSDGSYHYFAFVQYKKRRKSEPKVFRLFDTGNLSVDDTQKVYSANNWYGCLYYDIKSVKSGRSRMYMLMGFDFADDFSNKKLLDVLYFKNSKPYLGKPIISYKNKLQNRLIFEYAEQARMSLRYDANYGMIIWDHLMPPNRTLLGKYEYYGPDGTHDGLRFERGGWIFYPNVEVLNLD